MISGEKTGKILECANFAPKIPATSNSNVSVTCAQAMSSPKEAPKSLEI